MWTKIVLFTICALFCTGGCGNLKHLVNEGLVPATKKTAKESGVVAGANIAVDQHNLAEMAGSVKVALTGIPDKMIVKYDHPTSNFTYDAVRQGGGTFTMIVPKDSKVRVRIYKPDDFGGAILIHQKTIHASQVYTWDAEHKKLESKVRK